VEGLLWDGTELRLVCAEDKGCSSARDTAGAPELHGYNDPRGRVMRMTGGVRRKLA